ncbi:class I SAM-dependent methyltransferase [Seohaeicola sp. SP36]|uniref:class I SAM-dependent methyltransferase n=1 Tax=unclassified Seohaeicola TaxID=2641111 RepID=UPI00237B015F|nr:MULTISPECIES: class I SAM-dependent methyltransferase [unclassified Seohaeicola]MDD9706544.1 class I SAM-dependent methyltransferase [Seohaeicola sp. 4SK31]MDD9734250.1 class I SAM-dependent methyltransferase [Seohaeicola sp. SP36]
MGQDKINTQAIGLDVGLAFTKWLTGAENLHYGLWDGLEVSAANLRAAQEAYTDRLFALLPDRPCRILDIGGGAGETAKKLLALGHSVDIVVPSPFLAGRCRANAPAARVHECMFEDFTAAPASFDLCLFSESFQYIPLDQGLPKCLTLLAPGGEIIVADCFRTPEYTGDRMLAPVGGGHRIVAFRETLATLPLDIVSEEDVTLSAAPSVEIEQGLFNVFGYGLTRVDQDLARHKPRLRWLLRRAIRTLISERKRARLDQRLNQQTRNRENFARFNIYLLMRLRPKA